MSAVAAAAKKSVLISGGSIAGPATAFWLNKYGFQTTIVERWQGVRPGGQSVDVNLYGEEAIRRMGLQKALKDRFTGEKGATFTDKDNAVWATFPVGWGPTNETEILRGDFADMLYTETKDETNWIFGDSITSVEEQVLAEKVKVGFQSGKEEVYDYVIIAEGSRSRTRKMVMGEGGYESKPIGCYIAYFSIPLEGATPFPDQWHIMALPRSRTIYFRPDFKANTSRAGVMIHAPKSKGYEKLSPEEQKEVLAELFADGGATARNMIEGLKKSDDLYFEYLSQIHAPNWSTESGRVILTGDSAWCGTPMIGMGTSLSVAGAYVLAGEMAKNRDDPKAIAAGYKANFGQIVKEAQPLPPGMPGLLFQETEWGTKVFLTIMKVLGKIMSSKMVQGFFTAAGNLWSRISPAAEYKKLPEYGQYLVKRD